MFVPDPEQRVDPAQIRIESALVDLWGQCVRYTVLLPTRQMYNSYTVRAASKAAAVERCLWWLLDTDGTNILLSDTTVADVDRV